MNAEGWLQLSDYSNKFRVSVSTLRRRIKAGEIEYQFDEGKYWLPDRPIEKYGRNRKTASTPKKNEPKTTQMEITPEPPSNDVFLFNDGTQFPVQPQIEEAMIESPTQAPSLNSEQYVTREELLNITNNMISEIKSAYVLVLQEKEAFIMECKKEIADLKTLCHTLESENEKLKTEAQAPLSGWFVDDDSGVEV